MKKNLIALGLMIVLLAACTTSGDRDGSELTGLDAVAAELGVSAEELTSALGDPELGPPDFDEAAATLGVDAVELEELMSVLAAPEESAEMEPYTLTLNGIDFIVSYEVFPWDELPADALYERQSVLEYTQDGGATHYYEVIFLPEGNLNWYQCAYLAQDAGGYLACPTSEGENSFLFEQINDKKYFWSFPEEGDHYGISIGPFLGGFQPEGSVESAGGWSWLSGESWEYANWAVNLDDGVTDKDPRPNDQPNDSGDGQPIMGFGEMNLPVPTWGDYMDSIGTYGKDKLPGRSYAFIIEYDSDPR